MVCEVKLGAKILLSKTIVCLTNSRNFYAPVNFVKAIWLP